MPKPDKKTFTVELTEFDIELILIGLGRLCNDRDNQKSRRRSIDVVVSKIYAAMGVKID